MTFIAFVASGSIRSRAFTLRKDCVRCAVLPHALPNAARQVQACLKGESPRVSSPAIKYCAIQHIGLLVKDTAVAKQFYMEVLGMEDDDGLRNPKLPFAGAFLRAGSSQIHLMELPTLNPKEGRPEHGGRDTHAAITLESLNPLMASLERHQIKYTVSKSGRRAIFLRDCDMNALEFIEVNAR